MGETRFGKAKAPLVEIGRAAVQLAQSELAEMRQRQALVRKQNDMLDLIEPTYLGLSQVLMDYYLPQNFPLNAVRYYIEQDEDYAPLADCDAADFSASFKRQRQAHLQSRMAFLDGGGYADGGSREFRWRVLFNLAVIGSLKDADLLEDHRRVLDEFYQSTKEMVGSNLNWMAKQLLYKDYPFIHPQKGSSPFLKK